MQLASSSLLRLGGTNEAELRAKESVYVLLELVGSIYDL